MKLEKMDRECPLCHGTGIIKGNLTTSKVKALNKKGLSIGLIAEILGKGRTTIFWHLHKKKTRKYSMRNREKF